MKTIKKLLSLTLATIIMVSMLPAHAEETEESHGTGLQAMTEDRRNELMKHAITHTDDEPIKYSNVTSVDNSNTDYFPSIANQGGKMGHVLHMQQHTISYHIPYRKR